MTTFTILPHYRSTLGIPQRPVPSNWFLEGKHDEQVTEGTRLNGFNAEPEQHPASDPHIPSL